MARRNVLKSMRCGTVCLTKYSVLFDAFPLGISVTDEHGTPMPPEELTSAGAA
ncbi:MAG TPA: hypothetical protein VGK32_15350 [Vicinamibacterales bacterium]|jgi:hypothetical protein